jgi:hypothetical protein
LDFFTVQVKQGSDTSKQEWGEFLHVPGDPLLTHDRAGNAKLRLAFHACSWDVKIVDYCLCRQIKKLQNLSSEFLFRSAT